MANKPETTVQGCDFFLWGHTHLVSVNCAAVRGRETPWKAWDDTSRGDRHEVDKRSRAVASPLLSLRLEKRELARLEEYLAFITRRYERRTLASVCIFYVL